MFVLVFQAMKRMVEPKIAGLFMSLLSNQMFYCDFLLHPHTHWAGVTRRPVPTSDFQGGRATGLVGLGLVGLQVDGSGSLCV